MDLTTKKAQKAKQYLDTHNDHKVGPSELAKAIDCTRGTARNYIAEWSNDHGDSEEIDQGGQSASTAPVDSPMGDSTGQSDQGRDLPKDYPKAKPKVPKKPAAPAPDEDEGDGDDDLDVADLVF